MSKYCPRIDHFVRFNQNNTIGKCGHMIGAPAFSSWHEMQNSQWLLDIKKQMEAGLLPPECQRCADTEKIDSTHSVRLQSLPRHKILSAINKDYLILGGVLDNVCNSACQSCSAGFSTKIGSLYDKKNYIKINNQSLMDRVPLDRVVELDLNGGEPTASPAYKSLLENLPDSVKVIRVNTNGSRLLPNIVGILDRKIHVIVTLSLDGTGPVHDYARWPIKWDDYCRIVDQYIELARQHKNLSLQAWTTVHALNLGDLGRILDFADTKGLDHSWAYLENPPELNPKKQNHLTISAKSSLTACDDPRIQKILSLTAVDENNQDTLDCFIESQDRLRNINIKDYIS